MQKFKTVLEAAMPLSRPYLTGSFKDEEKANFDSDWIGFSI